MIRMRAQNFLLALALGLLPQITRAEDTTLWALKPDQSPVTFVATGKPGFLKIKGEGGRIEGTAKIEGTRLSGTFDVTVADFKTGIDLRDEHMHGKYLESGKFKTARLTLDPLTVEPAAGEKEYAFTGKLTLKDVEKPVAGKLTLALKDAKATGTASFSLRLSDYPVGVPSHLGVTVAESVDVQIDFAAERRTDVAAKP